MSVSFSLARCECTRTKTQASSFHGFSHANGCFVIARPLSCGLESRYRHTVEVGGNVLHKEERCGELGVQLVHRVQGLPLATVVARLGERVESLHVSADLTEWPAVRLVGAR